MFHGHLWRVSELVVVSGAVIEQQRIADLDQQLHHAESASLAAETRAALLDARQNEARAIDLKSIGIPRTSQRVPKLRFQFTAYCGAMDADTRRQMEEASRSEVPILTGSVRHGGSRQVSTVLLHACAFVRWWSERKILDCPDDVQGCSWTSRAACSLRLNSCNSAFGVFERLYRALSNEEVPENLKVAVAHKNLQDAELRKHLLRSAATLDSFPRVKDEIVNYSLAQAAWGTAPTEVDQVNLVKGTGKKFKGKAMAKATARARLRLTFRVASTATGKDTSSPTVLRRSSTTR